MKKRQLKQLRPNSAKTYGYNSQERINESALLNLTMKNYYKDYEKLRTLIRLPGKTPKEDYKTSIKKVNALLDQLNDFSDFCAYPSRYTTSFDMWDRTISLKSNQSQLENKENISEDYMRRLKRSIRVEQGQVYEAGDNEYDQYDFDNNKKELSQLKEDSHSDKSDDDNEKGYNNCEDKDQEINEGNDNKEKEDEDEEHYSFNDKEEVIPDKNKDKYPVKEEDEDKEEYKFDEEIQNEADQHVPTEDEIIKENVNAVNTQLSKQEVKADAKGKAKDQDISKEDIKKEDNEVIKEDRIDSDLSANYNKPNDKDMDKPKDNKPIESNDLHSPSPQQFTNDFFEDTNDKLILDEFEKKVFNKETNILQLDNRSISNDDTTMHSEKKATVIQRTWKRFSLKKILNEHRLKLTIELDRTKEYVIFIYADKVDSNNNTIEKLFLKVYCIKKMKTLFDWFTINDLKQFSIIPKENTGLTIEAFKSIKDKVEEKIVELIINQNIRKETEGKLRYDHQ